MSRRVAVVAHSGKSIGGGLPELRRCLADAGCVDPLWYEVDKSRKAPKRVRAAVDAGVELLYAWGGDGMVQRCADALSGTGVELAVVPAGTANLLATNLGIPGDVARAVHVGLHGAHRPLDLGTVNGEHFAVMAGAGFDAAMIGDADSGLKDRIGRSAYILTGARNLNRGTVRAKVEVDGEPFHDGPVGCVLAGNVGSLFGGVTVFDEARPDDGRLEVAVVTAGTPWQWMRVLGRVVWSHPQDSPFVRMTHAHQVKVRFKQKTPYELDGGDRTPTRELDIGVVRHAVTVRVPGLSHDAGETSEGGPR